MEFPLNESETLAFVRDSTRLTQPVWLTDAVFTRPQLREEYGSVIILPVWLAASTQVIMLVDAEDIGQGIHAFYHDGEVSCEDIRAQLDGLPGQPVQIYAYGELRPLQEHEAIQPLLGGVFRVVPFGAQASWASHIEPRLTRPDLWDPDTPHVGHLPASHLAFQTENRQLIRPVSRDHTYTPLTAASELFQRAQDQIWVRVPTERFLGLYWRGKRVHSAIAVVEQHDYPSEDYSVIFFDLRGLGHWVIWVAIDTNYIFPGDVIEELRVPHLPGFSLVINGGRRGPRQGMLYVRDGDVLEASLQRTSDLTPTDNPAGESAGEDGDESDWDGSHLDDPLPDSDDFPDRRVRDGGDQRGWGGAGRGLLDSGRQAGSAKCFASFPARRLAGAHRSRRPTSGACHLRDPVCSNFRAALRARVVQMHGTRPKSAWRLPDDWEAEWSRSSADVGSSAVHSRLWTWIPKVLWDAWDSFLDGSDIQLSGPQSFWTSPLAVPFLGFRAEVHVN